MLKKSACNFNLIGNKAPPAARDSSDVAMFRPATVDIVGVWSSSLPFLVGFSIQGKILDVVRSASQRAH